MACRNSVLSTFVLRENLGDISAKNDAQNTIANLTGMALGIGAARILPESTPVRLATFWALTSVYSVLNYLSMKSVTLRTLNRQRAGIVIAAFLDDRPIPSPTYANTHERIVPFVKRRFSDPALDLGAPLSVLEDGLGSLVRTARARDDRFILELSPTALHVVLHRDATSDDQLEAYLAFMHVRRALGAALNDGQCAGVDMFHEARARCVPTARRLWTQVDPATRYKQVEASRAYARRNVARLKALLDKAGYNTSTTLFAPGRSRAVY
jgi:Vitamin B6 photo-protection and homoeostasis